MPLYIGIDGGGTKTTCVVGNEASILGTASAGGSNVIRLGEATARANLQAAISQACAAAGVRAENVDAACVGLAGAGRAEVDAVVRDAVSQVLPAAEIEIVGDMVIAMEAALGGLPGVIVIAGTGSIAFGRNQHGQTARAGGWGFAISDEGSGQWIGREAVRAAMRAHDADTPTLLLDAVLHSWNLAGLDDLIRFANSSPPPDFSQLFPRVLQVAQQHDLIGSKVLARAGRELAELAAVVLRRLWPERTSVRIGIAGGVFSHSAAVRLAFFTHLRERSAGVAVSFRISEPVAGALALARKKLRPAGVSRR